MAPGMEHLREVVGEIPSGRLPVVHTYCNRRNTVQRVVMGDAEVVVKRFRRPNLVNSLVYTHLRPSKGDRSLDNALRFISAGLPTPRPIAVITDHVCGRLTDSWYVSEYVDAAPIGAVVTEKERPVMDTLFETMPMMRQFFDFAVRLFAAGIYQRDFNRGNFLAREGEDGEWTFPMVDINRVQYGAVTPAMVAMAWVRFGCDTCPGLVERLTVEAGRRLGLDDGECRQEARRAVARGARIERRRQFKRALRRRFRR